jgi:hypothetical protein
MRVERVSIHRLEILVAVAVALVQQDQMAEELGQAV